MSEISTEKSERVRMSDVAEASFLIQEVAGLPMRPVKSAIGRAVMRVSKFLPPREPMTASRAEDIWYRQARRIDACEMDALRLALRQRKEENARGQINGAAAALRSLRDRYAASDPDFFREQIRAIEQALRETGFGAFAECGADCALDQAEALILPQAPSDHGGGA